MGPQDRLSLPHSRAEEQLGVTGQDVGTDPPSAG